MHYVVVCRDAEPGSDRRQAALDEHRRHVDRYADRIVLSGPLLADDGTTRCGQLFVLELPDRASAQRFVDDDPFTRAGIFESTRVDSVHLVVRDGRRV